MTELLLIGIGTGNPDHLTLEAVSALRSAEIVLLPRKGADKADLADLRRMICERHLSAQGQVIEFDLPRRDASGDYLPGVRDWHEAIARIWAGLLAGHPASRVALLVWGDPSLYDSSLRIAGRLREAGSELTIRVVPGITSLQMLTAAHGIPLNTLGAPFLVTTGRRLREGGWPEGVDTVAVMLDGECSFAHLPGDGLHIWWGGYVGMPQQILIAGPLGEAGPRIIAAREAARAEHGWIMDIYLLRRG
ncbi:precorrin-6A synthase (deacetylating) [Halodurantibacterium flavum]|uniref:Precorrin-6A synthase [deacetylating] n=1 Tax=Halodurantibacterium flavum TaxID=1382802 RepID=A0ABW4S6L3_9RHOB